MISLEKTPNTLRIILPVLWYGFIFCLTEWPFAAGNNTRETISGIISPENSHSYKIFILSEQINFVFRSSAHFFMFGVQAILIYFLLKPSFNFDKRLYWLVVIVAIGILGGMDEFHQSFVPGRRPRVVDVLIDCSGAMVLLFTSLWLKCIYLGKPLNK